jgi:hypothetical protein
VKRRGQAHNGCGVNESPVTSSHTDEAAIASDGNDFGANTPQSLAAFIKSETEKYRVAVKVSGSRVE